LTGTLVSVLVFRCFLLLIWEPIGWVRLVVLPVRMAAYKTVIVDVDNVWSGWLICMFSFYARKELCFQRVLAIAILSVRLSVTRVDQAKTVQARITKS